MIQYPENYYNVLVQPMNEKTEIIGGKRRELWVNKKYIQELFDFIDKLHEKQCLDKELTP